MKVKFKFFNKKLVSKLTAFSLAGSLVVGGMPVKVKASNNNQCDEVQTILEYKAIGEEYKAVKYKDNSIVIEQTTGKNKNKLKMNSQGEVVLTTYSTKYFGLVPEKSVNRFTITDFDGEFINIKKDCLDSDDMEKCISAIEKYINSNHFTDENYLATFGDALVDSTIYGLNTEEVGELSKQQYQESYSDYLSDLEENGYKIKTNNALSLATTLTLIGGMSQSYLGTATAMTTYSGGTAAGAALLILTVAVLYEAGLYISDSQVLSLDDIMARDYDLDIDKDNNYEFTKFDGSIWVLIDNCLDTIENNYDDNDPNNDYYKAKIFGDNKVYIDLTKAMSINDAVNVLEKYPIKKDNIYTYDSKDARAVIINAGGVPGLSKEDNDFKNLAECHAFSASHNAFDPNTLMFDLTKLKLKNNVSPGIYYWHFHFYGKKLNGQTNKAHIFFGVPVIVTSNDVSKYSNGINNSNLSYLDEYETFSTNYEKLKTLTKKK